MTTTSSAKADLFRALGTLAEEPRPEHRRLAEVLGLPETPGPGGFTDVFGLNLYPYASVHLGIEGKLGGEARDRVAGFWRALGLHPPREPDHLGSLLGLLAELAEREEREEEPAARTLLARARAALVREHLEPWLPPYLGRVEEIGGSHYAAWAALLLDALREEAERARELDRDSGSSRARRPPLHLRDVPTLPDPREPEGDGTAFLEALLAPVRSGLVLTRADLARAGRDLGLGTRMGERLYILKSLLGQEASATLSWLADEARRQAARHDEQRGFDEGVTAFWHERAATTARLLDELASAEVETHNGEMDHG